VHHFCTCQLAAHSVQLHKFRQKQLEVKAVLKHCTGCNAQTVFTRLCTPAPAPLATLHPIRLTPPPPQLQLLQVNRVNWLV
jgi:hypothetical protein